MHGLSLIVAQLGLKTYTSWEICTMNGHPVGPMAVPRELATAPGALSAELCIALNPVSFAVGSILHGGEVIPQNTTCE